MQLTTIHVTYNQADATLTVDQPDLTLDVVQVVQWIFLNAPPNALPHIIFHSSSGNEEVMFGPFQYLEPSSGSLTALGNIGGQQSYPYTLLLLNEDGPLGISSETTIHNNISIDAADRSPDALVTFHESEDPNRRIRVTPLQLHVPQGRTIIWYVHGMPPGHFVTFRFPHAADQMTGPFISFSMSRGFGQSWLANGAGLQLNEGPNPPTTSIHYRVTLRNALGTVVGIDDPTIEPLPPPPNTNAGG